MRADRLVALLLLIQARGRVTAAEVAVELEVSPATARRDLEALSSAGVPVYAQPGRGGGWSLVGGSRTDLTGLTAGEARALFLVAGGAAGSPEIRSALRKLVQALPEVFRADATAAASAVVVDPARWGAGRSGRPSVVAELQDAVVRRRRVGLVYGRGGERSVDPWALVDKDDVWYLLAGTTAGRRTFRVDRIVTLTVTDEPAERPDDLDVGAHWREVVEEMERRRSRVAATVLLPVRLYPILAGRFGRHCERLADADDGRACARVAAHTPLGVAQELAGWGAAVEVLEPESVRGELARLGHELVAGHADPRR